MTRAPDSLDQKKEFQKLLAQGDTPEARALAEALATQKNGLGSWGPRTRAAFAKACELAGVDPESVDFNNPDGEGFKKLMAHLQAPSQEQQNHTSLNGNRIGLNSLLEGSYGELTLIHDGDALAQRIIEAAKSKKIDLCDIKELAGADLDGDGKISKEEISSLIKAAHEKRTGKEYTLQLGQGTDIDGHMAPNPNYDKTITEADILAMTEPEVIKDATLDFGLKTGKITIDEMLKSEFEKNSQAFNKRIQELSETQTVSIPTTRDELKDCQTPQEMHAYLTKLYDSIAATVEHQQRDGTINIVSPWSRWKPEYQEFMNAWEEKDQGKIQGQFALINPASKTLDFPEPVHGGCFPDPKEKMSPNQKRMEELNERYGFDFPRYDYASMDSGKDVNLVTQGSPVQNTTRGIS